MRSAYHIGDGLIFVNKPAGIATHAPDHKLLGMAELVRLSLTEKPESFEQIFPLHRLDKTTTGALAFATTAKRAEEFFHAFKEHKVKKRYLFLTAAQSSQESFEITSHIEKTGEEVVSVLGGQTNSLTTMKRLKRNALYELWEAFPATGKTHQVRLHARDAGLPILGDSIYGGRRFPHLCLHASELRLPGEEPWICHSPPFFDRMGLLRDDELCLILSAIDRRQRLLNFVNEPSSTRLVHVESRQYCIDLLGPVMWVYWYKEADPTPLEIERFNFVAQYLGRQFLLRKMLNRGRDPQARRDFESEAVPQNWQANELAMQFRFSKDLGLSPGLFLDQRNNRQKVLELAKNKKVLNLFAYTCGFSLAAALGGSKDIISVDISKKYLEIGKENFRLNNLDLQGFAFLARDSMTYLQQALKQNKSFDLIVCDPPTFARVDNKVFKIEQEYPELLKSCWRLLNSGGRLLFSTNFEKMSLAQWQREIAKILPSAQLSLGETPLDFEGPFTEPLTKTFWVHKI